jgi:hypothetical protein
MHKNNSLSKTAAPQNRSQAPNCPAGLAFTQYSRGHSVPVTGLAPVNKSILDMGREEVTIGAQAKK